MQASLRAVGVQHSVSEIQMKAWAATVFKELPDEDFADTIEEFILALCDLSEAFPI